MTIQRDVCVKASGNVQSCRLVAAFGEEDGASLLSLSPLVFSLHANTLHPFLEKRSRK